MQFAFLLIFRMNFENNLISWCRMKNYLQIIYKHIYLVLSYHKDRQGRNLYNLEGFEQPAQALFGTLYTKK